MTIEEQHLEMVAKLCKKGNAILDTIDEKKTHLLHVSNGIADEYFELQIAIENDDIENVLEELGDLLFYTKALRTLCISDDPNWKYLSEFETMQTLYQVVKRHVFYNQDLNKMKLTDTYFSLLSMICEYGGKYGYTLDHIATSNMSKLSKRYPNFEFSDDRAKERADKCDCQGMEVCNKCANKDYEQV